MANTKALHDSLDPLETLSSQEAHEHHVHVTPFWTMFWVFAILLVLTALTVWSSNIHGFWFGNTEIVLGPTEHILMALVIATVKAVLVGAYFMHLKYDSAMNTAVVAATFFAVILFIGFTLADMSARTVLDRGAHQKIMAGGTSHRAADGTWVKGMNVTTAARENYKATHGPGDGHGTEGHSGDAHGDEKKTDKPAGGH